MKAYKLEVFVIDFDELGGQSIAETIECESYANDCIAPKVKSIQEVDIGEWTNDHPLNKHATHDEAYKKLFEGK